MYRQPMAFAADHRVLSPQIVTGHQMHLYAMHQTWNCVHLDSVSPAAPLDGFAYVLDGGDEAQKQPLEDLRRQESVDCFAIP